MQLCLLTYIPIVYLLPHSGNLEEKSMQNQSICSGDQEKVNSSPNTYSWRFSTKFCYLMSLNPQ